MPTRYELQRLRNKDQKAEHERTLYLFDQWSGTDVFLPNCTPNVDQTVHSVSIGPTISSFAYKEPVAPNRTPNQYDG